MTEQTIANLGLRVDSSQVEVANEELLQFVKASEQAEQAAGDLGDTTADAGKKVETSGRQLEGFSGKLRNALLTFTGADTRMRSLFTIFSEAPIRFTGIAAAVGVLAKAFNDGEKEALSFTRAMAASGNQAGVTLGQLQQMARELDEVNGTRRAATETLSLFVKSGNVGVENLRTFAGIAQQASKTLGVPLEEIAENFSKLGDKPKEAAIELNEALGFVTPALYDQIAALEKQGKTAEAASLLQQAYASDLLRQIQLVEPKLTTLGKGWEGVKKVAAEAWDSMAGIGVRDEIDERLDELRKAREEEGRALGQLNAKSFGGKLQQEANDAEERRIQGIVDARRAQAQATALAAAANIAYTRGQEEANRKDEEAKRAARQLAEARLAFDVGQIQRQLSGALAEYDAFSELLEAQREADLIDDNQYYAEKRRLVEQQVEVEAKALEAENARLSKQSGTAAERIRLQNQIAENEQRILELRKAAAAQLQVIAIQEQAALRDTKRAYEEAQAAADRYVETLAKRQRLEVQGLGLGNRERQRLRERSEIEGQFESRKQELDADFRRGDITKEQYENLLKIEQDALERSLSQYDHYYDELLRKQGDWKVGASEAFRNFMDEAQNVAGQVEQVLTRAFDGALDSLVDFVMTGKGNFGDLARSILADLLKIELKVQLSRVLGPILGGLGGLGGFGGANGGVTINGIGGEITFGGGRATGGSVWPGSSFDVGENGRERFVPTTSGLIMPSDQTGGGVHIHNVNHFGPGSNRAELEAMLERRDRALVSQVENVRRRRTR